MQKHPLTLRSNNAFHSCEAGVRWQMRMNFETQIKQLKQYTAPCNGIGISNYQTETEVNVQAFAMFACFLNVLFLNWTKFENNQLPRISPASLNSFLGGLSLIQSLLNCIAMFFFCCFFLNLCTAKTI